MTKNTGKNKKNGSYEEDYLVIIHLMMAVFEMPNIKKEYFLLCSRGRNAQVSANKKSTYFLNFNHPQQDDFRFHPGYPVDWTFCVVHRGNLRLLCWDPRVLIQNV